MHQLMLDKGFVLKEEEELKSIQERRAEELEQEEIKQARLQKKREEKQQRIMEQQKDATTNLDAEKKKEYEELTQRIKELKKEGGDKDLIKELSIRRTQLARETMIYAQARLEKTDAEKARFREKFKERKESTQERRDSNSKPSKREKKEEAVGSDEL